MKKLLLLFVMTTVVHTAFCQTLFTLQECINYAVENNCVLQKNKLDREKTIAAQREVLGALLPQVSASGGVTYNIQKTTFAMPNFVNSMMPAAMQDPQRCKIHDNFNGHELFCKRRNKSCAAGTQFLVVQCIKY